MNATLQDLWRSVQTKQRPQPTKKDAGKGLRIHSSLIGNALNLRGMHRHNASVHTGRYQVLKVDAGSVLVNDACATVQQIVESVRKVETIMGEISAAGDRQVAGIGLIGRAIDVMDQMTQQNSALVEEASAAAGSLSDQTAQLSDTLQVFKLGDGTLSQTSYPREYPAPGARLAPLTGA